MKKPLIAIVLFSAFLCIVGCNNDDNENGTTEIQVNKLSGYIQKGPFLNGTSVNLSELDEELNQTGLTFKSQVSDNSGNFEFNGIKLSSSVILLNANGFYFNEVKGENSSATLTLTAMVDINDKDKINVNVLTHLQKSRVEVLVAEGIAFQEATDSAQKELLKIFGVTNNNISASDQLNMFVNSEDNAILIALSIIIQGNKPVSDFSEFLANINLDFSDDGQIQDESLKAELYRSAQNLNLDVIEEHLKQRYKALGFGSNVPNFQEIVNNFLALKAPFEIEPELQNVSCKGIGDGMIDLTITGGTPPFKFEWSNRQKSEDLDGLPEGTFSVEITDSNGNSMEVNEIEITAPNELLATSEITNTNLGETTGAIDLSINGGTEPYSFEWSNNQETEDIHDLEKGTYNVKITDANGCSLNKGIIVQEEIELIFEITDIPCFAESTGAIDLTINGGVPPYSFEWSNNSSSEDVDTLQAGTYMVTVTDQLGYTTTGEVELDQNPEILIDYHVIRPTSGMSGGSINLSVTGGVPPYQYQWSDNSVGSQLNNISSGEYSVTVTDANSCSNTLVIPVYGEFVDSRDNKSYKTVQLGSQVWFAENLRSKLDNQGNSLNYFCISNSEPNCDALGYMYTFEVSQTACPQGWRMPVETDWQQLEQFLGMSQSEIEMMNAFRGTDSATRLREDGDTLLDIKLTGAIIAPNTPNESTVSMNEQAIFWSNTMFNSTNAILRGLFHDNNAIYRSNIEIEQFATCLRCIKE